MAEKMIDIQEIDRIINYKKCSVEEAIDTTTRYRNYSPAFAYKIGWLDGMRMSAQDLQNKYYAACDTIRKADKADTSDKG